MMPGVVNVVNFGSQPAAIPDQEINHVRAMVQSGLLVTPWPFLNVGQTVVLERGPLAGVEGILQEIKKTYRLVVSVHLLQRSVSTEVDRAWVRPLPPARLNERLTPSTEVRPMRVPSVR
jgi:transcription antitermination factor NusG